MADYATELRAGWSQPLSTVPAALVPPGLDTVVQDSEATPSHSSGAEPLVWVARAEPSNPTGRQFCGEATETFFRAMEAMVSGAGISFAGRVALVTGCSQGSIGVELVKALLEGGATVVATTSRFGPQRTAFFQRLHREHGATGSALYAYPFNQASRRDCEALVAHVYEGLGMDVDVVVPFAAVPENGRQVTSLDARAELAHRVMLTNTLRIIGAIARAKERRGLTAKPAAALLPLSPNHGVFGNDGLYAESKIGLETLLRKWHSEDWAPYITVVGAVIGWTRGTGLMEANNLVAPGVERAGCRTFSTAEMALNLTALLHPAVLELADLGPLCAELGGGFENVADLRALVQRERERVAAEAATRKAIAADARHDRGAAAASAARGTSGRSTRPTRESLTPLSLSRGAAAPLPPRANLRGPAFPTLPSDEDLRALRKLEGMADLDTVPVVVGFGEVGPWGNARTRWEMEAYGEFSLEGCVEMAWLLGFIKHAKKSRGPRDTFVGWVDSQSGDPVPDHEVRSLRCTAPYGRSFADLRLGVPFPPGQGPLRRAHPPARRRPHHRPRALQRLRPRPQAAVARGRGGQGLAAHRGGGQGGGGGASAPGPPRCPERGAIACPLALTSPARGWSRPRLGATTQTCSRARTAGGKSSCAVAPPSVSRAPSASTALWRGRCALTEPPLSYGSAVLATPLTPSPLPSQIPRGWDATRLGVPPELARTVDPVTLYALVSTVEALQGAGITDPYEFYEVRSAMTMPHVAPLPSFPSLPSTCT